MAKPEWGSKRVCQSCEVRFYDLRRDPIICPSCGTKFDPESVLRSRRNRAAGTVTAAAPKVPAAKVAPEADVEPVVEEEDVVAIDADKEADDTSDDEIIEDTNDISEDSYKVPDGPQKGDQDDA